MANEIQKLEIELTGWGGAALDVDDLITGAFTLTFDGQTTSSLSYTDLQGTGITAIETALEGLSNIGSGDVNVTNTTSGVEIEFLAAMADTNQPQIMINITTAFKLRADRMNVSHAVLGVTPANEFQYIYFEDATDGTFDITISGIGGPETVATRDAAGVEAALDILLGSSNYNLVDNTFNVQIEFIGTYALQDIATISITNDTRTTGTNNAYSAGSVDGTSGNACQITLEFDSTYPYPDEGSFLIQDTGSPGGTTTYISYNASDTGISTAFNDSGGGGFTAFLNNTGWATSPTGNLPAGGSFTVTAGSSFNTGDSIIGYSPNGGGPPARTISATTATVTEGSGVPVPITTLIEGVVDTSTADLVNVQVPLETLIEGVVETSTAELSSILKLDSIFDGVIETGIATLTNQQKVTSTFAATTTTSTALVANIRKLSHTIAAVVTPGYREIQRIYFPGWLGVGGSFVLDFVGSPVNSVSWDGVTPGDLATNLQTELAFLGGSCSVFNASDVVAIDVTFAYSSVPVDVPNLTLTSHTGPAAPTISEVNRGGRVLMNVTRKIDSTFAGSITVLEELTMSIVSTFSAVVSTGNANLSNNRKLEATIAATTTTGSAVLGTKVFISGTWATALSTSTASIVIYCRLYSTWQVVVTTSGYAGFHHRVESQFDAVVATGSAQLGNNRKLSGTIPAGISTAAFAMTGRHLTTTIPGVVVVTGNLLNPRELVSTWAATTTTSTATATNTRKFTQTIQATVQTSTASLRQSNTSTFSAVVSTVGNAIIRKKLTTSIAASVLPAALATNTRKATSTIAAVLSTSGNTTPRLRIVSTWSPSVSTTGNPTPRRKMTSTFAVTTTTPTVLATTRQKQANTFAAIVQTGSALATTTRKASSTVQGVVNVQAVLTNTRKLSHSIGPILSTAGAIGVRRGFSSSFAGVISTTGLVDLDRKLRTTFAGSVLTTGLVDLERNLSMRIGGSVVTFDNRPNFNEYDSRECWNLSPRSYVWVLPDTTFQEEGF